VLKLTTKFGPETIAMLNGELIAAAVEEGLVDVSWLRADTTVVPADIKYPTDSGLLTKGIAKITTLVRRIQSAGAAGRTLFDDETPANSPSCRNSLWSGKTCAAERQPDG
jgi:IS5 family transposase